MTLLGYTIACLAGALVIVWLSQKLSYEDYEKEWL